MVKIKISLAAYNELQTAFERLGIKSISSEKIILEPDHQITTDVDYKLVTIRRDIADIASKSYETFENKEPFVEYVNKLYNYVMFGPVKNEKE